MRNHFFAVLILSLSTLSFADPVPPVNAPSPQQFIQFNVVQDQFVFDNTTIKSASVIENNGVYVGLHIELKPAAAIALENLTTSDIGRHLNVVLNNRIITTTIIQTPLKDNLLISGISKQDALTFINILQNTKKPVQHEGDLMANTEQA